MVGCYKPFSGRAVTWIVRRVAQSQRVGGRWWIRLNRSSRSASPRWRDSSDQRLVYP